MTTDIPAASATPSVRALYGAYWRNAKGKRLHILYSSLLLIGSQLIKLGIPVKLHAEQLSNQKGA